MRRCLRFGLLSVLSLAMSSSVDAGSWMQWRGPTQDGVAPNGNYPLEWSLTKNLRWSIPLTGPGGSTPIVVEDKIIYTCPRDGLNCVFCIDRHGKPLWDASLGQEIPGKNKKGTGSNPSPISNGKLVYVYYKNGDFACFDLSGHKQWEYNLQSKYGPSTLWWDLGTSPVLTKENVVIAVMQSHEGRDGPVQGGDSFLVAFNQQSGEIAWKVPRELGAPIEAGHGYSTPVVIEVNGRQEIIVLGADHVTCHDAANGRELWRVGGLNPDQSPNFRSISGPVVSDGIVIAPYARGKTLTAIRLGGAGDVSASNVLWTRSDSGADVPTPVAHAGRVYVPRDKNGEVLCRDIESGDEIWRVELEKHRLACSSSPILAGDRLYITREDSVTFVVSAKDGKLLAKNELNGEFIVASPVLVDDMILIRTFEKLYCIGKK